ncbi:hypothetical protein WP3W18E01_45600 [Raoultella ornithinolytica]|nr:hypothetical protein AI2711V1_4491 [Raoultella ornithinolytica]CAH3732951.1 hypothetical protein AI2711V1_4491 [Raoultella ornithinolytica]VTN46058.1 Uncharacterised protein [Raoultella ornithinolytica]VTN66174.1 Uncharacterised protein [Raoultella ornithinolytica]BBQ80592.1 hypothetical protein WP3W18E01_45600 [Raoultella ornithinolytica]
MDISTLIFAPRHIQLSAEESCLLCWLKKQKPHRNTLFILNAI